MGHSSSSSAGSLLPFQVQTSLCCSQCFLHRSHDQLPSWPSWDSRLLGLRRQTHSALHSCCTPSMSNLGCGSLTFDIWYCSRRQPCTACSCSSSQSGRTAHTLPHACARGARPSAPPVSVCSLLAAGTCPSWTAQVLVGKVPRPIEHGSQVSCWLLEGTGRELEWNRHTLGDSRAGRVCRTMVSCS